MSAADADKTRRRVRWILFIALSFTAPLFLYLFVVGGIVSYAELVVWTIAGLTDPVGIVVAIHALIYGWLLFMLSGWLAKRVCSGPDADIAARMWVTLAILLAVSLLPIFGFFGHGAYEGEFALQSLWKMLFRRGGL